MALKKTLILRRPAQRAVSKDAQRAVRDFHDERSGQHPRSWRRETQITLADGRGSPRSSRTRPMAVWVFARYLESPAAIPALNWPGGDESSPRTSCP